MRKSNDYTIVKIVESNRTIYRVIGAEKPNDDAICQALAEAAQDAWPYLTTTVGTYTAAQLVTSKMTVGLRKDTQMPEEMALVSVECGTFKCTVGLKDKQGKGNYAMLYRCLADFESMTRVALDERCRFTASMDLGKLVCEARVVLPADIRAICQCTAKDSYYINMNYPAIDLNRRCIVATDSTILVAKKVFVGAIHYEGKVPETFCLPKEVATMRGEVIVRRYENGSSVTDSRGTTAETECCLRYPRWETVWPKYRGGMTIVDSKVMTKAVKGVACSLPQKGKNQDTEALMLTHEERTDAIGICGYCEKEKMSTQNIPECVARDEVAWQMPVSAVHLQKALALQPKMMWAGYQECGVLPHILVMEDMQADMAVIIHCSSGDDIPKINEKYATDALDCRKIFHCFEDNGWLLEQMETKYPTCGGSKTEQKEDVRGKKEETQTSSIIHQPSVSDRLRAALRARLVAA